MRVIAKSVHPQQVNRQHIPVVSADEYSTGITEPELAESMQCGIVTVIGA